MKNENFGPVYELLDRTFTKKFEKNLEGYHQFLNSCVDFGTKIIKWEIESKAIIDDELLPLLQFRSILTTLDGISNLILYGSQEPIANLTRSLLDASLQIQFIVLEDEVEKAKALFAFQRFTKMQYYKRNIQIYEKQKGIKLSESEFQTYSAQFCEYERSTIALLNSSKYKKYYVKLSARTKPKYWYSLYDPKINSIYDLSKKLDLEEWYITLYSDWSSQSHGTELISHGVTKISKTDFVGINQLRLPYRIQEYVSLSFMIIDLVFNHYVKKRIPSRWNEYSLWKTSTMPTFRKLIETQFIIPNE